MKTFLKRHKWITSTFVVISVLLVGGASSGGCGHGGSSNNAQAKAVQQQNDITAHLIANQPPPNLTYSNERQNLNERYTRYSDPNKISYITVFATTGQVIYHGVVKGKVSNLSSQLTPADGLTCQHNGGKVPDGCGVVQIAEPDGSWSTNGAGIFWFDDRGVYHETTFPYFVSDQPTEMSSQPILSISANATTPNVAPKPLVAPPTTAKP